jgi:lipid-binding SYLF domain-containing protein
VNGLRECCFKPGEDVLTARNPGQGKGAITRRFIQFAVVAVAAAALGCAHTGATSSDSKTTKVDKDTAAVQGEASSKDSNEQHRQKILALKDLTLSDLYKLKPEAREVIEKAEGYAVFDASGLFVVLYVGITGRGVLIDNSNAEATYMTMVRAGTGLGVGYEKLRYVIVFKNKSLLDTFKTVGGDVGASGHLVAKGFGKGAGTGVQRSFDPMLSVYQISDAGLAAEASWGATVFAPDPTLNPKMPSPEPAAASNSATGQQTLESGRADVKEH